MPRDQGAGSVAPGTGIADGEPSPAEREAARLRAALERRGPLEARLRANRGQAAIVRERDQRIDEAFSRSVRRDACLLDVGCGTGSVVARLLRKGLVGSGTGVDLLAERIEIARASHPGIAFEVADATQLPFDDASFDAVLAMTVFSSVPLAARHLLAAEIARVVRPGGVFVWYDMRRPNPRNPDVHPFTAADVRRLLVGWDVASRPATLLPPVARRLGRLTPVAYRLLARVPMLLSHEVGTARRPGA